MPIVRPVGPGRRKVQYSSNRESQWPAEVRAAGRNSKNRIMLFCGFKWGFGPEPLADGWSPIAEP